MNPPVSISNMMDALAQLFIEKYHDDIPSDRHGHVIAKSGFRWFKKFALDQNHAISDIYDITVEVIQGQVSMNCIKSVSKMLKKPDL